MLDGIPIAGVQQCNLQQGEAEVAWQIGLTRARAHV